MGLARCVTDNTVTVLCVCIHTSHSKSAYYQEKERDGYTYIGERGPSMGGPTLPSNTEKSIYLSIYNIYIYKGSEKCLALSYFLHIIDLFGSLYIFQ